MLLWKLVSRNQRCYSHLSHWTTREVPKGLFFFFFLHPVCEKHLKIFQPRQEWLSSSPHLHTWKQVIYTHWKHISVVLGEHWETQGDEGANFSKLRKTSDMCRECKQSNWNEALTSLCLRGNLESWLFALMRAMFLSALLLTQRVAWRSFIGKACSKGIQSSKDETSDLSRSL